jgi:hypothetical protein
MPKKPLRSQLNQIRAWVRQGRTDAWIAHQLEVSASELRDFRRRHGLSPDGEEGTEEDLRDEIEAEIEAATLADEVSEEEGEEEAEEEAGEGEERPAGAGRRRRRGGRRRRGAGRGAERERPATLQGTFDHGEQDGFGLWLDPAVKDEAVYSEHWAGHRPVEVSIEADRITIRRVDTDS